MAKRRGKRPATPLYREAAKILAASGPMHYRDLAEKIIAGGRKPRGKTFTQTLSATLIRRPEFFRAAPGVYGVHDYVGADGSVGELKTKENRDA